MKIEPFSDIQQLVIDKIGRKPMLLGGSALMCSSMVIVGIIVAKFGQDWPAHVAAGWTAVGESFSPYFSPKICLLYFLFDIDILIRI